METSSSHPDKHTIRTRCLETRRNIKPDSAKAAARALAISLVEIVPPKIIVAGYIAMRGEIDVMDALTQLHVRLQQLCLPVVEKPDYPLVFHRWQPGEALAAGAHGTKIPSDREPVMPDVVIVPLVAFDKAGHRLGYGAGYYDRTIAQLREAKKDVLIVGAGYSFQQADILPAQAHDQKLDIVVTEKEVIRFT